MKDEIKKIKFNLTPQEHIKEIKECGVKFTGSQYYCLYKEDIEKLVKYSEKRDKEIERLNNIINNANKVLQDILVINNSEHKGKYRPIKNTSKNDVYKSVCMLYGILGTPYRCDYGSLQELKGDSSNE